MNNSTKEAALELFDFEKKNVFCSFIDQSYVNGLLRRGASLYFSEEHLKSIEWNKAFNKNELSKIHFIDTKKDITLDFQILTFLEYKKISQKNISFANKTIIFIKNRNFLSNTFFFKKKLFKEKVLNIYFVVPSFSNIKFILPEEKDLNFERYWGLKSSNLFLTLKLISEWFLIKNKILRKIFSDKIIILK